jgi:ribonuclease PH
MRQDGRKNDELRPIGFEAGIQRDPHGSVLVSFGATRVLTSVMVEEKAPPFLRGKGEGWLTAEYSMLPGCSKDRIPRDGAKGRPSGRSQEISRLIGRALRAALDRKKLGERTLLVDCDVIQADGGTRTASITGGWVALALALRRLREEGRLESDPLVEQIAAVSVGLGGRTLLVDLDYPEDSTARVDLNLVGSASGGLVEIQGTAEQGVIQPAELSRLVAAGRHALSRIFDAQQLAIAAAGRPSPARRRR